MSLISPTIMSLARKAGKKKTGYAGCDNINGIIRYAKEYGLRCLGAGPYSVVFEHEEDSKKVVKITLSAQDAYHKYVQWVLANAPLLKPRQRRHLPRIYETIVYKGTRITVIERLSKANSHYIELDERVNEAVRSVADMLGFSDDSGGANLMVRGKIGVITDPWAHKDYPKSSYC